MPYYRELQDGNKILVSKMMMLTKADAIYVANCMNSAYGDYFYKASPNFLGYEGADYGINYYHKFSFADTNSNSYAGYIRHDELLKLCSDRQIVHQSESWV